MSEIERLRAALKQLVADYEDVPDPTDEDGQEAFKRAREALGEGQSAEPVEAEIGRLRTYVGTEIGRLREDYKRTFVELEAEIGRLRTAFRVNMMRYGATDAEINAVLNVEQKERDLSRYNVGSPERPLYECLTCHTQDPYAYQHCGSPQCDHWLKV